MCVLLCLGLKQGVCEGRDVHQMCLICWSCDHCMLPPPHGPPQCLCPLYSVDGWEVTTVEGIGRCGPVRWWPCDLLRVPPRTACAACATCAVCAACATCAVCAACATCAACAARTACAACAAPHCVCCVCHLCCVCIGQPMATTPCKRGLHNTMGASVATAPRAL